MIGIVITAPPLVVVGEVAAIVVRLVADRTHAVRSVTARVIERQQCGAMTNRRERMVARLLGATELHGSMARTLELELPRDAPPTHWTGNAIVSYELTVDVDVPWRADITETASLRVAWPKHPIAIDTAEHVESGPGLGLGTRGKEYATGDVIVGALTIYGATRPDSVAVALVALIRGSDGAVEHREVAKIAVPIPPRQHRTSWKLTVPETVAPTLETTTHRVTWALVADDRVMLPIVLVSGGPSAAPPTPPEPRELRSSEPLPAPNPVVVLPIDEPELVAVFREHAERTAWTQLDKRAEIALDVPPVQLRIAIERRDRLLLVAHLAYPRLGLGLPDARSPQQAEPFTRAVEAALGKELVALDDRGAVIERVIARLDDARLAGFAGRLEVVARELRDAIARIPPRIPSQDPAAWAALAEAFHGTYAAADGSVLGELEGIPLAITVGTRDDREVLVLALDGGTLRAELPLDASPDRVRAMALGLRRLLGRSAEPYR